MKIVSPNTEAILLLTAPLLIGKKIESAKPLAPKEYRELASALIEIGRQPADLLQDSVLLDQIAQGVAADRVKKLLNRGLQLSQALDMWSQRGIRVLSRADQEYPRLFKMRLRDNAPVLLYCCGNLQLFNKGGLAVVGSRKVDDHYELVEYTDKVGAACAREQISIVSGGAKGADKISMMGSLKKGGMSVGILSCKLKQEVLSKDYKPYLRENRLLLCSAADPSAGWNTGMAMQRNKYIYALANHGLVIASETKGGTWEGATEQLNKLKFCPVMVNTSVLPTSGSKKLLKMGAKPLSLDFSKPIAAQLKDAELISTQSIQPELFAEKEAAPEVKESPAPKDIFAEHDAGVKKRMKRALEAGRANKAGAEEPAETVIPGKEELSPEKQIENALFPILKRLLVEAKTSAELVELTKLKKGQLDDWLKKMCEQGVIEKKKNPVRYIAL